MKKPYKYLVFCEKTKQIVNETNIEPSSCYLTTWEPIEGVDNVWELKKTKTVYIDTRYEAKLRLYNYITYTKKGLPIPKYKPFEGTEIGKTIPILNF